VNESVSLIGEREEGRDTHKKRKKEALRGGRSGSGGWEGMRM